MTLYAFKPGFQTLLRPWAHRLVETGVTANQITLLAAIGSILIGAFVATLASSYPIVFLLIPLWMTARMALNAIDGMMAREFGQKSQLGAYLNETGDVVSDIALIWPFAFLPALSASWIFAVIILATLTELCSILGLAMGGTRRYDGPMGKSDRALVFGVLGLWAGLGWGLPSWTIWLLPLIAALLAYTCFNRIKASLAEAAVRTESMVSSATTSPPPKPLIHYPTQRTVEESTFHTHDGIELFYRRWPATAPRKGAILLFHRGHEHGARMGHLADELALPDFDIFAWDARGHGRSPGLRGYSPNVAASVRDIQSFAAHIFTTHGVPIEDMAVVAQSVGAVLAAAWAHDYAPKIRALVLASPAFHVKLYVPFAKLGLTVMKKLRGTFFVNSYVKAKFLTHDTARQASYDADPLITRPIAVNILLGLHETSTRIVQDAGAITQPTQLLISGSDWVVRHGPQHRFFENLGAATKERHVLPDFYHDTLGERDRMVAVAEARRFLLASFEEKLDKPNLLDADRLGFTRQEADRLATPLPFFSPRGLFWALTRLNLKAGALISSGLRLGEHTGYDSGAMLDFVYRNKPESWNPVGRWIDRTYLGAIGWRGIRQRKIHVEELLQEGMQGLKTRQMPVRILDIAAGHGRYVLDALASAERPESLLLRDYDESNVASGQRLIAERGLSDVAHFEKGDAFDTQSLASIEPRTTLGIVSGLYELFPDNRQVTRSLGGLAQAIEPGGYIVYTNQPWHPQLEFIARALLSHRTDAAGQLLPWVMRRRTQAEMDQLVEAAGFRKITQRIDEWGIFTVSLAQRTAP